MITVDKSHKARKYTSGRRGSSIKEIVIHHWGSEGQKFDGIVNWFCYNPACQTSAHFVVEDGRVAQIVELKDTAYHAGKWGRNIQSVGIEARPEMTDGDFDWTARTVAHIWNSIGREVPVVAHRDIVPTNCPGKYYARIGELRNLARSYYKGNNLSSATDRLAIDGSWGRATTLATQKKLHVGVYDGVISGQPKGAHGTYIHASYPSGWEFTTGSGGSVTVKAIQKLVGASQDGLLGPNTIRAMQKFLGVSVDGHLGPGTVKAWQRYLNSI